MRTKTNNSMYNKMTTICCCCCCCCMLFKFWKR